MRYQKIESRIWHDEKFCTLTPSQQRLFFYILTCPHGNLTGLFVLKPGYASEDLKCLPKDFNKDLRKLCEMALVSYDFDTSVILVHNFLKHNPITNPNQRKAVITQIKNLPKSQLIQKFIELNPDHHEGLAEVLNKVLLKPDSDSDSDSDTDTDSDKNICQPSADASNGLNVQTLAKLWNEKAPPELSKVNLPFKRPPKAMTKISDALKRNPDGEWWCRVFERIHQSPFLRGEKGWKASIDFAVGKAEEILDGKYDGSKRSPAASGAVEWLESRRRDDAIPG